MPKDDVKRLGRIEYIEPNNMFVHSEGNTVQNGIPQPYEDYSFSVNLRVINGDRFGCGMTNSGDDILENVLEYSSENGTLSFMDGTVAGGQSYFTTNFTDISMNNPDTNTRECLGIDNISIRYDSWYYPTVEIRFIDVRGASLMQPAEYEYYNNGGNMAGKAYHESNSKFFKSFFTFPYPLFKLSVKGFYGKELTYDLSVLKTNIIFNSDTGNFEIIANFIGYMYGMYADLPFPFIYLAPYIDLYGKNTWDEKRGNGDFCYIDTKKENKGNTMMHTFPELKMAVENAGKRAEKEYGTNICGQTMEDLDVLVKYIDQNLLFKFPVTKGNYEWWKWSKTDTDENSSGYFFITLENTAENNRNVFEDFYNFSNSLHEYNELVNSSRTEYCRSKKLIYKEEYETIWQKAEEIKKKHKYNSEKYYTVEKTVSSDFTDNEISEILGIKIANLAFHREDNENDETSVLIFDEKTSEFTKNGKSEFSDLIDELLTRFKNKEVRSPMQRGVYESSWNIKAIKVNNIHYYNELVSFVNNDLRKKLDELKKGLDQLRTQKIRDAIGFEPTIKNLYNLIFAHTDTFMSCFYNTLDKIREKIQGTDDSRKYEKLCGGPGSAKIEVDVSDNALKNDSPNGGKLPPFTMFYKEEAIKDSKETKLVAIWPGSLTGSGGDKLDEVQLVEAIVNATSLTRRRFTPVSEKDNIVRLKGDVVPTNYYDIIRNYGNPYLDILNDKTVNEQDIGEEIIKIFMLRCFYSLLNGSYLKPLDETKKDSSSSNITNFSEKAKLIAKLEINNVRRAFQMLKMGPSQALINQMLGISSDGSLFLSKYLNENNPIFSSNGSGTELFYKWIKRKDSNSYSYLYPVGIFSSSTLDVFSKGGQDAKGDIKKFLLMNQNGALLNSFSAHLYNGGKQLENVLDKYGTSDFANASRLFPNYKSLPKELAGITFYKVPTLENTINIENTVKTDIAGKDNSELTLGKLYSQSEDNINPDILPRIPSARKTSAGYTSIFMDPLYYAQEDKKRENGKISKAIEARAYLFLMGIPYGFDKKFLLPNEAENGDYPTLMLLREGAIYWRNDFIQQYYYTGNTQGIIECDPITYTYTINGITNNVLTDIETNDPCFGIKYPVEFELNKAIGVTKARKQLLIDYFLVWANGVKKERAADATAESYVKREFKKPIIDFQTIENMLGLYENVFVGSSDVILPQLLNPTSCSSAVTASAATSFANGSVLKVIYNVGKDNKLGKVNGKIRTDVQLSPASKINEVSENLKQFLENFTKFYFGFDTILDYATFDSKNKNLSVPKNAINDALSEFIYDLKDYCGVTSEQIKNSNGIDSTGKQDEKEVKREFFKNDNLKLACYMALKNLYDRWLCNRKREHWRFSVFPERLTDSDFSRFFYIDEFYHDNGMQIQPSLTKFINNVSNLGGFTEESNPENLTSSSLISILCDTAEYAGAALLTLPTMLGLARNYADDSRSKIDEVFKAYPYNERVHTDEIETSFVVLYSNQKSSFLDNPDDKGNNGYRQDGFDIADTWGEIVPQSMFSDVSDSSYVVPCFGVTFAKQNQSFFKNLRLSMDNHQVTDFSIRNEVMISYQSNMGPRETPMVGQDMYNVFSNYSYSCTVSMMGDAQITPLMYFQLNNIPMWKGAYMITTVHHNISIKGMDTEFTGVRQARPTVPYVDEQINTAADNDITEAPYEDKKEVQPAQTDDLNISKRPLDTIDVEKVEYIVFVLDRMSLRNRTDGYNFIDGVLSARVYLKDSIDKKPINYNNIANTLEPYTALKGKIENFTPDENESFFAIPAGRYIENIRVENIPVNAEYRSANDSFYSFTDGRHILITDEKLKNKDGVRLYCEMVTGGTSMDGIDGGGISSFSFGGTCPIMLQGDTVNENGEVDVNKQFDKDEIRATYKEVFNLIKRMNNAGKRISLFINETDGLPTKIIK